MQRVGAGFTHKPNLARGRVGSGFGNKTHPAGWVISGWVAGSGWVVRTLSVTELTQESRRTSLYYLSRIIDASDQFFE
jgi:hypothetical protein